MPKSNNVPASPGRRGSPYFLVIIASLVILCVACGSSSSPKLYVVGLGFADVQSFSISGSGSLTADSSVTGVGGQPTAILLNRHHAYVLNSASATQPGSITELNVGGKGALSPARTATALSNTTLSATPPATGLNPRAMATDPANKFVFVANQGSNSISVYQVDSSTGLLTEVTGSPFATGAAPSGVAAAATAIIVANQGAGTASVYTFDQNGKLTLAGTPVPAGTSPTSVDVDSSGKLVYIADSAGNSVTAFTLSGSTLSAVAGSPFAAGTTPVHVRVVGSNLFVANAGSNNVSAYAINTGSGVLTAASGSPFAAGTAPVYSAAGNSGKTLFVANQGSSNISAFQVGSGGALSAVSGSPFATLAASTSALAASN